ncbi:hypothetical protein FBU30_009713 [Linnemannia zychae]|nr:hypothetical protein FBU30_009713 [Linnemannia zychae]
MTTELQKLAETHNLPFIYIYPSADSSIENSSIFDIQTKNLDAKKVVAVVRFPQIGPTAGMVLIYNEKKFNLIGLIFIKVPIPNLTLNIPAALQQQQLAGQPAQQTVIGSPSILATSNPAIQALGIRGQPTGTPTLVQNPQAAPFGSPLMTIQQRIQLQQTQAQQQQLMLQHQQQQAAQQQAQQQHAQQQQQ